MQTWRFRKESRVRIGRSEQNEVVIGDPYASRFHCELRFQGEHCAGLETRVLKDHLARTYEAEVGAAFPLNFEIVELASSGIFCLKHPFHPFTEQIHLVAKRVMGG